MRKIIKNLKKLEFVAFDLFKNMLSTVTMWETKNFREKKFFTHFYSNWFIATGFEIDRNKKWSYGDKTKKQEYRTDRT